MKNKVLKYIKDNKMIGYGEAVVIGVSGGADSMCLLHMMENIGREFELKLMVLHVHHGIRKETADRDAEFVAKYCEERNIAYIIERACVPELSKEWGMSEEEAGRKVRYDAFGEALKQLGGGKIAVAHNADDSAETVLLNLFRGSGIKGMTGILPVRDNVIRPVLCLTRKEIEEYNISNNVKYVDDETNFMAEYTRNKLRLEIMPAIKVAINGRAAEHINMAGQSLCLINDYMEKQCEEIYGLSVTKYENGSLYIDGKRFCSLHIAMQSQLAKKCLYEVAGKAKDITNRHINALKDLFLQEVGRKINLPYGILAVKEYDGVTVSKGVIKKEEKTHRHAPDEKGEFVISVNEDMSYRISLAESEAVLSIEKAQYNEMIFIENKYTKWINCDRIKGNLLLRTRQDGDYIIVNDNGARKKLKDYFIDKKIPRDERNRIWLLARGSEIIWIVGYRLSAAYKVNNGTEKIVKCSIRGGCSNERTS